MAAERYSFHRRRNSFTIGAKLMVTWEMSDKMTVVAQLIPEDYERKLIDDA